MIKLRPELRRWAKEIRGWLGKFVSREEVVERLLGAGVGLEREEVVEALGFWDQGMPAKAVDRLRREFVERLPVMDDSWLIYSLNGIVTGESTATEKLSAIRTLMKLKQGGEVATGYADRVQGSGGDEED